MPSTAEYVILQVALPSRRTRNVGVLLLDRSTDRLYRKLREDWESLAEDDDAEVLTHLGDDIEMKSREMGGERFLRHLEDTLSNSVLITDREAVAVTSRLRSLERLYDQFVEKVKVIPFRTHLPVYSLAAAATKFGPDLDTETIEVEPEDWAPAPERLRITPEMFVAHVVGRSMEPLIPDGSLCVFRGNVVGSRQGKRLLIEQRGRTGSEFTVKKYSSVKVESEAGEWAHSRIRLEPLNPEFEPMEFSPEDESRAFRVIGEFVEVLE